MKSTASQFHEWQNTPLPLEAIAGSPILAEAQTLRAATGMPLEAALSVPVMALVAAVGPTRYVHNPIGYSVPASMNLILSAGTSALLSGMIRAEFAGFHRIVQAEVKRATYEDSRRRAEDIVQTRIQLLTAEDILSGRRMPKIDHGPLSARDPELAAEQTARAMPYALKEAKSLKEKIEKILVGLTMASCPYWVADALSAEELCTPEQISFDLAFLNLALAGETLGSIRNASHQRLGQLGRILAASWSGTAPFSSSGSRPYRPLISNLWVATPEEARAFLECRPLVEQISPSFLTVNAEPITPPDYSAPADVAGWPACLDFFLKSRFTGQQVEHQLAEAAFPIFLKFIREVDAVMSEIPSPGQCSARHWPDACLKLSLLLHLGGYDPRPPDTKEKGQPTEGATQPGAVPPPTIIIGEATVRFAIALTKRIAGAQMGLLASQDKSQVGAAKPDPELEKMCGKLKCSGPLTQRDLFRKYSKQKNALLIPVLLRGMAAGRIIRERDLLCAADFPVNETVSGSAASNVSTGDFSATSHSDNSQSKNGV